LSKAGARRLLFRLRHPRSTVRWRLTLLYGGLFLVCGAALLAVTYGLVAHATVSGRDVLALVPARGDKLALPVPASGTRALKATPGPVPNFQPRNAQTALPPQIRRVLGSPAGLAVVRYVGSQQRISDLHQLEIESAIALAIMTIISALLGWLVAGRVLRPLRTITATTHEISEANLHRRLALSGPPDELRTLADTIDGLLERLQSAFDAQRRFVANASHELRTPLTAVRALLEMVVSDPHATVETFRETCREALEESEQEEQLIDALLALAQGQRGLDRRAPVDLASVTTEAVRVRQADASRDHVDLEAALEPAWLLGDRRLIARLVSNLVHNAIRHNVPNGHVHVRVHADAGRASLTITNTGPVVPADQIGRLLQPFQGLAPDRLGHPDGFGLGLSIVAAIAAAHDAALDIQPGEHGGLHVEVRFPMAPTADRRATADRDMPREAASKPLSALGREV
jgi:signal transduction histidine kinase